jgi:hypothetical protein
MRNRANLTLSTILLCVAVFTTAHPAFTQCILDPNSAGQNGQTRLQNFYTLVDDLYRGEVDPAYDFKPTHQITANGKILQTPPWYKTSTECGATNLQIYEEFSSPTLANYLVNGDELSELAIVTALANNDGRMLKMHNTIQTLIEGMAGTPYHGLPCWLARATQDSLTCFREDTASDITARFGLAYYYAANNPSFPASSRATYRAAGDALAARHLEVEYAYGCHNSPVTGEEFCEWVGGGANTSAHEVSDIVMWIGYHQDIVRFLLAAYESTGNTTYADRAEEVIDQWLIASTFNGADLTFGRYNFKWNTTAQPIAPQPGNPWFWQEGRAWDVSDAPRALWMGDVLRAFHLSSGGAPLTTAYAKLSKWVQLLLSNGTQTATTSCVEYNQNGSAVPGNCGTDYYYNGLGAGLHTYNGISTLDDKLDRALVQYGWSGGKTWNNAACFGIYRGIRPVKALAAAIGLDSATYGGTSCLAASPPPASLPSAPTWLRVDTVSQSELKLTWQDNSNNEAGFKVERKEGCCGPWTLLPNASANSTNTATHQNTGLKCGTSYAYRVWAYNSAGESAKTNEAARTTSACN